MMHPKDAEARGIKAGDLVYVYNDAGCMRVPAQITRRQIPGVVSIGEGAWYQPSAEETYTAWFDEKAAPRMPIRFPWTLAARSIP